MGTQVADLLAYNTSAAQLNAYNGSSGLAAYGIYNVKLYGALGDGTTDDAEAVQAAIDAAEAAGGGIVFFPPAGTYYINTQINLASNVDLIGDRATITLGDVIFLASSKDNIKISGFKFYDTTRKVLFTLNSDNILVENCTFDTIATGYPSTVTAYNSHCFHIQVCNPIRIINCKFYNIHSDNVIRIEGEGSTVIMMGIDIDTTYYKGIAFATNSPNNNGILFGSVLRNIGINHPDTGVGTVGVYGNYSNSANPNFNIIGNYFEKTVENSIEGSFGIVSKNTIIDAGYKPSVSITTTSIFGISPYNSKVVSENYINNARGPGIKLYTITESISNVKWINNTIHNCDLDGVGGTNNGMYFSVTTAAASNVMLSGNTITNDDGDASLFVYTDNSTNVRVFNNFYNSFIDNDSDALYGFETIENYTVLRAPNETRYKVTVDNTGTLGTAPA